MQSDQKIFNYGRSRYPYELVNNPLNTASNLQKFSRQQWEWPNKLGMLSAHETRYTVMQYLVCKEGTDGFGFH